MAEKTIIAWTDHTFNVAATCAPYMIGPKSYYLRKDMLYWGAVLYDPRTT